MKVGAGSRPWRDLPAQTVRRGPPTRAVGSLERQGDPDAASERRAQGTCLDAPRHHPIDLQRRSRCAVSRFMPRTGAHYSAARASCRARFPRGFTAPPHWNCLDWKPSWLAPDERHRADERGRQSATEQEQPTGAWPTGRTRRQGGHMAEPNHELTDSEAQAFQPEPHLQHLLKRIPPGCAEPPAGSGTPAERPDPARGTHDKDAARRPAPSSRRKLQ